jgi:hypothetical protein
LPTLKTKQVIKTLCIGLAVGTLLVVGLTYFYKKGDGELPVYTTAISRMVDGSEIYRRDDTKAFTYPPFAAVPFLPFLALPTELHPGLWYLINICVFTYVFRRLHFLVMDWLPGDTNRRHRQFFWIILLLLVARHLSSVFESKANDILMLLLMFEAARLAADQRYSLLGVWAGIGAAFKATPWLFLPVLVWQKRFVAAGILVAVAAIAHLIPDVVFPRSAGGSWTLSWYSTFLSKVSVEKPVDAEGAWAAWNYLNQSITATLYRLSTPFDGSAAHALNVNLWLLEGRSLTLLNIAAQLTVLSIVILATKTITGATDLQRFGQVGAVLCGMLLLSPMSSKSHFAALSL